MLRATALFFLGVFCTVSIGSAILSWHYYHTRPITVNNEICSLDQALVRILGRGVQNIPKAKKYDKYRKQYALDISDIQTNSAC